MGRGLALQVEGRSAIPVIPTYCLTSSGLSRAVLGIVEDGEGEESDENLMRAIKDTDTLVFGCILAYCMYLPLTACTQTSDLIHKSITVKIKSKVCFHYSLLEGCLVD